MNTIDNLGSADELGVKCTIKIALFRKGMSQTELAERLGVSPQQMNNWVNKRSVPKMETLLKMSEILECTINDFYELEDE